VQPPNTDQNLLRQSPQCRPTKFRMPDEYSETKKSAAPMARQKRSIYVFVTLVGTAREDTVHGRDRAHGKWRCHRAQRVWSDVPSRKFRAQAHRRAELRDRTLFLVGTARCAVRARKPGATNLVGRPIAKVPRPIPFFQQTYLVHRAIGSGVVTA
jgi:hypothetical protein